MLQRATVHDLPQILAIQAVCYPSIEPEQEASYLNKLEQAPDCAFVMKDQDQVLAYLFALPIELHQPPTLNAQHFTVPKHANSLYLHDLAIAPSAQGQGLSRPLLQAFFQQAQSRQLAHRSLIAIQGTSPFWQGYGFTDASLNKHPAIVQKLRSYGDAQYLIYR